MKDWMLAAMGSAAIASGGCASAATAPRPLDAAVAAPALPAEEGHGSVSAPEASGWKGEKLDRWQFSATPFLWMTGLDTTMKVDGKSASASEGFQDLLPSLDLAVMAHLEASRGPWAVLAEGTWMDLSSETTHPVLGKTTVSLSEFIGEGAVAYRFLREPLHAGGVPGFDEVLSLEAYGGARYTRIHGNINPGAFGSASEAVDWTDPILGMRARLAVSPRYALIARGDAGGFRGNSDNSWFFLAGMEWRPSAAVAVDLGYAVLNQKYRDGSDPGDFELHQRLSGPIVGVSFRF